MDIPTVSLYAPNFLGFIFPPIIEMLNKDIHDESKRFLVALGICFFTALLFNYNNVVMGNVDELIKSFGLLFAESQIIFKLYFKNSFVRATMVERLNRVDEPAG